MGSKNGGISKDFRSLRNCWSGLWST